MRNKRHVMGFTLPELAIGVLVAGIVIPVVLGILFQVVRLSVKGFAIFMLQDNKILSSDFILKDLRSASRNSVASTLMNGGFEDADGTNPAYWAAAVGGTGEYTHEDSESNQIVYNGYRSLSLRSQDANSVTYDSTHTIVLNQGGAYWITARIRSSDSNTSGKVALWDTDGNELASFSTTNTNWHQAGFRYPTTFPDTYSGGLTNDQVFVRLTVTPPDLAGTGQWVYFDDVAVTQIHSVIYDQLSTNINIENDKIDTVNPEAAESTGFKFIRWDGPDPNLYRYRVDIKSFGRYFKRERYDADSDSWVSDGGHRLSNSVQNITITYDETGAIPSSGKKDVVNILVTQTNPADGTDESFTITAYPLAP